MPMCFSKTLHSLSVGRSLFITTLLMFFISNIPLFSQMQNFGTIHFPNSGNAKSQSAFEMGMLLLHSFEYSDARENFKKAQQFDKNFAMAYWGEAMTYNHPIWFQQDKEKAVAALNKISRDPEGRILAANLKGEKLLLEAANILFGRGSKEERDVNYMNFLAKAHEQYPINDEIACFYALSLMGSRHNGRHIPTYLKAAEIAGKVLQRNPQHPGALHYTIHAYDEPTNAQRGLAAANAYAKVAPGSEHALHMPSHIFVALGYWDRVVASNEAAWEAGEHRFKTKDLAHSRRAYHALLWLNYGYLQQGNFDKAKACIEIMHGDYLNHYSIRAKTHLNQMRAAYLVHTDQWDSDIAKINLTIGKSRIENAALNLFVNGLVALKKGQLARVNSFVGEIHDLAQNGGTNLLDADMEKCFAPGTMPKQTRRNRTALIFGKSLEGLLLAKKGQHQKAEVLFKEATALEDNLSFSFGPPMIVIPSHELYAEFLLTQKRYKEAVVHFERTLERAPRRSLTLNGLYHAAMKANQLKKAEDTKALIQEIAIN